MIAQGTTPTPAPATPPAPPGELGPLTDEAPDTMTLHTRDAWELFAGRAADPEGRWPAIAGGRRFAAALKSIWHLSANDNPYADWILVRTVGHLAGIRAHLDQAIAAREAEFERLQRRGLSLSVLGSRRPANVALGFRSPYGYATAQALVEFDYHVRLVRTLVQKDRMSDAEGKAAIRESARALRALFLEPLRWERHLLREELRPLCRSDFLPGADEAARRRVRAAVALFGELPRRVFTGEDAPRHSKRRVALGEGDLRMLQEASLTVTESADAPQGDLL